MGFGLHLGGIGLAHAIRLTGLMAAHERQMSLNGSGDMAVYRTVLVMLAWPGKC